MICRQGRLNPAATTPNRQSRSISIGFVETRTPNPLTLAFWISLVVPLAVLRSNKRQEPNLNRQQTLIIGLFQGVGDRFVDFS